MKPLRKKVVIIDREARKERRMDDKEIVRLFWQRDERAVTETSVKYGRLCGKIACGILGNPQDGEEIVNHAYMRLWETIPPKNPEPFMPYLAKIVRNLALNRYKAEHTQKRFSGEYAVSLDELDECVPDKKGEESSAAEIRDCLNAFLERQKPEVRSVFVMRYFFCESVEEISKTGFSEGKLKSLLFRTRNKLKSYLESEGIFI